MKKKNKNDERNEKQWVLVALWKERYFISGQLNNSLSCLITLKTPAILNNNHNENDDDADVDVDVDGSKKVWLCAS